VDGAGRLRFQVRMRVAGRGARQWARTVDTFAQAVALRERFEAARRGRGLAELRGQQLARMRFEQFVEEWWARHVERHCNGVTQLGYRQTLGYSLLPFFQGWRLEDIGEEAVEEFLDWCVRHKAAGVARRAQQRKQQTQAAA
jgi:hypothetical protein